MKIYGTGIDIVEIDRIKKSIDRYQDNFASKILHEEEVIEYESANNKEAFLAKRFAVKEAFVKALGTGIRDHVSWRKMYISHDQNGKPSLMFTEEFAKQIHADTLDVHISISDEKKYVVAQAIITK